MSEQRALFDPADPFDAMAQSFKTQIAEMVLRADRTAIYRDLGPVKQLECFLSGVMTGMIGVCFASVEPAGRDAVMEYLQKCLPVARELAESIILDGAKHANEKETGETPRT